MNKSALQNYLKKDNIIKLTKNKINTIYTVAQNTIIIFFLDAKGSIKLKLN